MATTVAIDSRHQSSLVWCSNGAVKYYRSFVLWDVTEQCPLGICDLGELKAQHSPKLVYGTSAARAHE